MTTVAINITGATYKSRSSPLSAQLTQNFYAELVDNVSAKSYFVLHSFPGLKLFGATDGIGRGMFIHNEIVYRVCGEVLYSVNAAGTHTQLGEITGTGRCVFDGIGSNVVLATQGQAYQFDFDGSTVTEITDANLETPNSLTHLKNVIIYDGDEGRFVSSDVGDATSIDGLNYATAESNADDLVRVYAFDEKLFLFGIKTTERWWFSGQGSPPLDLLEGGIFQIGLAAIHSVSSNDDSLYFLADDNHVYSITSGTKAQVTDITTHRRIASYGNISDATGFNFTLEGQRFYQLNFPLQDETILYSENTKQWTTLSSDGGRHFGNSHIFAFRKHLMEDYRNGNIYELDLDTFTDNGEEIIKTRDTGPLHGGLFGAPGKTVEMNSFELIMETGAGTLTGQGIEPEIMLSFSDDGGKTFSNELRGRIGSLGEFQRKVEWFALGSFYERIIRVSVSDPVFVSIHSAAADITIGI